MAETIIDKALVGTKGISLTPSGDIKTVASVLVNFQAAQVRIMSDIETWLQDDAFGSTLRKTFREKGAYNITEDDIISAASLALKPLLEDGRLSSLDSVNILDRTSETLFIELVVIAGTQRGKIPLEIS